MKLSIRHRTAYRFDQPVFLEPHVIRLRPRGDAALWPLALTLDVDPTPAVRAENLDAEGNVVTQAWFNGTTDRFTIEARSVVETLSTDPYRFLLDDADVALPYVYPAQLGSRLFTYRRPPEQVSPGVRALASEAAEEVGRRRDRFPMALTDRLHREFQVEYREDGMPRDPGATIGLRSGACRDLAVLFIECCHGVGLAARFVSGYAYVDDSERQELHAWAEVFLPGGGWRGYDPTLGLAVADRHVAVAAAADPADAAPVSGSFRGGAVAMIENIVQVALASGVESRPATPGP